MHALVGRHGLQQPAADLFSPELGAHQRILGPSGSDGLIQGIAGGLCHGRCRGKGSNSSIPDRRPGNNGLVRADIPNSGGSVRTVLICMLRPMRALSFFFALMLGLVLASVAPALAGGRGQTPEAMLAPAAAEIGTESSDPLATDGQATDLLATDLLAADLLAELSIDLAPSLDASV